ncbi:aldo/keto reductase [Streptomyces sp. NPDC087843]|uniref:aldo/keto reductase n=1 Tax=Streptomyces sp. NPDC087843 TaxID=3365804 RepID=UPI003823C9A0
MRRRHGLAHRKGTVAACEGSLRRLRAERLDLYLLHWRGRWPLEETLAGFTDLMEAEKIRYWGVSNLDVAGMVELTALPGGDAGAVDQVLYNLSRRGVEWDLLPWCREAGVTVMAYSPIEQGRLLKVEALGAVARALGATPAQVALAWVLAQGTAAIPRSGSPDHIREIRGAVDIHLPTEALAALDEAFPPPSGPTPLEIL